jgi:hypothetical protein
VIYERLQIESLLQANDRSVVRGSGLFLMPQRDTMRRVYELAVAPAFEKCGIAGHGAAIVFDSDSNLHELGKWLTESDLIVADVSRPHAADLLYVLGLAHGLGRCPLLITDSAVELPFNLGALRWVEYRDHNDGLAELREHLVRAIRVFLASSRGNTS